MPFQRYRQDLTFSTMLPLSDTDLRLPNNIQLAIAASCLGAVALINYVFFSSTEGSLSLPPSPPTWKLRGHFITGPK